MRCAEGGWFIKVVKSPPDFIIGGTLPAGTGQLYSILLQHPEIYLPLPMAPECNFFYKSRDFERGIEFYHQKYFANRGQQKAVGERSSLLLSGARWTAERLQAHCPNVKLIFMLRNPVDRAYANYRFTALSGFETLSFEEALEVEEDRLESTQDPFFKELEIYSYFKRGLYFEQLREFQLRFPKENILVFRSDSLIKEYEKTIAKILKFIGVDSAIKLNMKSDFSSPFVIDLQSQANLYSRFPVEFAQSVQRIREGLPLETECDELIFKNISFAKTEIKAETRKMLYAKFLESNMKLRTVVDFAIDDWFC